MKKLQLKTNVMCSSCIAKITPALDELAGRGNWEVDILDPKKILTVSSTSLSEEEIISAVEKAGYKAATT